MSKKVKIILGIMTLAVAILAGNRVVGTHAASGATIYEGVFIGKTDVSGMTLLEAEDAAKAIADTILTTPITLNCEGKTVEVMPEVIGLTWLNKDVADEAIELGRCGNLIKRYKDQKDLKESSVEFKLIFAVDEELLRTFLTEKEKKFNVEAIDNGLTFDGSNFTFVEGQAGVALVIEDSIGEITGLYEEGILEPVTEIKLVSEIDEPRGTREELSRIKDVLASFHTDYSSSAAGRCANVANATSLINGTVVYPGEVFSVHDTISPITIENGYEMAGAYENGTVVEAVGGGVCQVSSTLYNTVIRAELEVVERSPHSMIVTYVQPSQDAAIAGDYKDFKFRNNSDAPIYIQGYTRNKQCYFVIYGEETRDPNRKVTFESEIESEEHPDPVFNTVNEPIGYVNKVQGVHTGYKCVLYKVVTINGKQISREVFNRSKYKPSAAIYEIGIKSDYPEAIKAIKEAIASGDIEKIKAAAGYWSDEAIKKRQNPDPEPGDDEGDDDDEE
ncbi:MAG: VanW family protein [Lachnospiraceae bacterium]|nr:VanW family protein [Lachnospiraceae bacterium]